MTIKFGLVTVLAVTALSGPGARAALSTGVPSGAAATVEQLEERIESAFRLVRDDNGKAALPILKSVVAEQAFPELDPEVRHLALYEAALLELGDNDPTGALKHAKLAAAMSEAVGADWHLLESAAYAAKDNDEAAIAITTIAQKWPETLPQVSDGDIAIVAGDLVDRPEEETRRFDLFACLQDAGWKPRDPLQDIDGIWLDLARGYVKRGQADRAAKSLELVRDPYVIAIVRYDKTFDPVVRAKPDGFDVAKVSETRIEELKRLVAADPSSLYRVLILADALENEGREAEAVVLLDDALAKALPADGSKSAFSEVRQYLNWLYDYRAKALLHLGRLDDALGDAQRGARGVPSATVNISELLNLAEMYNQLGRPRDALTALIDVQPRDVTGHYAMSVAQERICAYAQLGDADQIAKSLAWATPRVTDDPKYVEDMLVCANDLKGAADLLIRRLRTPSMRMQALAQVQHWKGYPKQTALEALIDQRWRTICARPDVQAAISAVGRVEEFPIYPEGG